MLRNQVPTDLGYLADMNGNGSGGKTALVNGSYVVGKKVRAGSASGVIFTVHVAFGTGLQGGTITIKVTAKENAEDANFNDTDLLSSSDKDGGAPVIEHVIADPAGHVADVPFEVVDQLGRDVFYVQVKTTKGAGALDATDIVQIRGRQAA
jgi:hypothetical protein